MDESSSTPPGSKLSTCRSSIPAKRSYYHSDPWRRSIETTRSRDGIEFAGSRSTKIPGDGAAGGDVLVVAGEDEVGPDVAVEAVDARAAQVGGAAAGLLLVGRQEADGEGVGLAGRGVEEVGGAVGPLDVP